jgi:hypothetical protein
VGNWDQALTTIGAVAAALTALLGILPAAADRYRGRTHTAQQRGHIRVVRFQAPSPWWDRLNKVLTDKTGQRAEARRKLNRTLLTASSFLALVLTVGYVVAGKNQGLPPWALILGGGAGAVATCGLGYYAVVLRRHPGRGTVAATYSGSALVTGDVDEVRQLCQVALLDMGARLVTIRPSEIVAATGVMLGPIWLGNRVVVTTHRTPGGRVLVTVTSTKLDYVTTSRSKKDIVRFLSSWVFTPSSEP